MTVITVLFFNFNKWLLSEWFNIYWCIYISVSEHFGWVKTWILLFISSWCI